MINNNWLWGWLYAIEAQQEIMIFQKWYFWTFLDMQFSQQLAPKTVTLLWLFDKDEMKVVDTIGERRLHERILQLLLGSWKVGRGSGL